MSIVIRQQPERSNAYRATAPIATRLRPAASIALRAAACAVVAVLLTVTVPGVAGLHMITVTGGSMGDALPIGSVAVTRTIDFEHVALGDIVVFRDSAAAATVLHRVVAINSVGGKRQAITRGDHNASPDPTPLVLQGRGDRVVYSVPVVGYLSILAVSFPSASAVMRKPSRSSMGPTFSVPSQLPTMGLAGSFLGGSFFGSPANAETASNKSPANPA